MTIEEVLVAANSLGSEERWIRSLQCGKHDLKTLPLTDVDGVFMPLRYCPACYGLFTPIGEVLNMPQVPRGPVRAHSRS